MERTTDLFSKKRGMKKEIICGIYKIESLSGCIYIGQSTNCRQRELDYKSRKKSKQRRLANSINKYGWENHKFDIIHICLPSELDILEKHYIELFKTFNTDKKTGRINK